VGRCLPETRVVVADGGHFVGFPCIHVSVSSPEQFVPTVDFGSIGLGLATALGAALARPDHTTVLFVGDGGLSMSLQELETAVRERVRLLVVVLDDQAYVAEVHHLRVQGKDPACAYMRSPDFVAVAEGFGWAGRRITRLAELETAVEEFRADPAARPSLLHVPIRDDVVADWFGRKLAQIYR
jgi:thiamine pyrophosphate-dependent acetolactate synthase large subunit-like protein